VPGKFDVFLCYNPQDQDAVEVIARQLKVAGVNPWFPPWELPPGMPWQQLFEEQIKSVPAAAVFIGSQELRPWQDQIQAAFLREFAERKCPVIPVFLSGWDLASLPTFLKAMTPVDFSENNEKAMENLVWGITGIKPEDNPEGDEARGNTAELERLKEERDLARNDGRDTGRYERRMLELRRESRDGLHLSKNDKLGNGRYLLSTKIGSGGYADVWKALDTTVDRPVAIKILHNQYARDETRKERFFRGARKMASLTHPGVVRVYEAEREENGRFFFVMEHVCGGDLREAVLKGRFPAEKVIPFILKLGTILEAAHKAGVVHRDLKPANVLLDEGGNPKLTDFDLVYAGDTTGGTRTGGLGTFLYTAPEMMKNAKEPKPDVDVYGLAMTTIFCFLGEGLSLDVIRDPSGFIGDLPCPEAVKRVLARGISWKSEARFRSAELFCEGLREAVKRDAGDGLARPEKRREGGIFLPRLSMTLLAFFFLAGGLSTVIYRYAKPVFFEPVEAAVTDPLEENRANELPSEGKANLNEKVGEGKVITGEQAAGDSIEAQKLKTIPASLFANPLHAEKRDIPLTDRVSMAMVWLKPDSFMMGSPEYEKGRDFDETLHKVTLTKGFWMGQTEVSWEQWLAVMGPHEKAPAKIDRPVTYVSWHDAQNFLKKLNENSKGILFRLPTEAEWEYACRAGSSDAFSFGADITLAQVNYSGKYAYTDPENVNRRGGTVPVGLLPANGWGLREMHGNVWEWCSDWYGPYADGELENPVGPPRGGVRVFRGGSWSDFARYCRSAERLRYRPVGRFHDLGFRVAAVQDHR